MKKYLYIFLVVFAFIATTTFALDLSGFGTFDTNSFGNFNSSFNPSSFNTGFDLSSFGGNNSFGNTFDTNSFGDFNSSFDASSFNTGFDLSSFGGNNSFGNTFDASSFNTGFDLNSFGNTFDTNSFGLNTGFDLNSFGNTFDTNSFGLNNNFNLNSFGNTFDTNSFGLNNNFNLNGFGLNNSLNLNNSGVFDLLSLPNDTFLSQILGGITPPDMGGDGTGDSTDSSIDLCEKKKDGYGKDTDVYAHHCYINIPSYYSGKYKGDTFKNLEWNKKEDGTYSFNYYVQLVCAGQDFTNVAKVEKDTLKINIRVGSFAFDHDLELGSNEIILTKTQAQDLVKAYKAKTSSIVQKGGVSGAIWVKSNNNETSCERPMDKSNALVPNIEKLVELVEENTPPTDPGNTPPTDPGNNPPSGAEVNKCKITLSFPSDHLVDGVAKYNTNHKMYFNIRVSDCSLDNVKFRDAKLGIDDYTISDIQQLGTGDYLGRSFKMHNGKLDLVYTLSAHPKALNYLKNKVSASNPILNTNAVLSVNQCTPNTDCKEKNVYWTNEQVPMSIDFSSVFPKSGGGSSGNNDINTNPDGSKSVLSSGDNDDSGDQILSFYPNKIIVRLTYLDQGDGTVCLGINDNEVETSMPFVKVTNNVDRALNIYSNLFYANSSELAYVQVSNKISKGQFYNVYPESYYRPVDNKWIEEAWTQVARGPKKFGEYYCLSKANLPQNSSVKLFPEYEAPSDWKNSSYADKLYKGGTFTLPVKFEYKDKTASVSLEKYVPVVQLKNVRGGILNVTTKVFKGGPGFTFGWGDNSTKNKAYRIMNGKVYLATIDGYTVNQNLLWENTGYMMGSGLSFQTFFDEVFANNKIALEKIRTKQSATMCFKAVYDIYDTNKKEYIKQGETSLTCPTVKIQR